MPLSAGDKLGPYEILAKIGAGGMGEVYRARDPRLKREVAIKVLPETFTADPARMARFQREAEVLASLDHPNIGAIYGLVEAGGTQALVLSLIDGPTLDERIATGALPLAEASAIAQQIIAALEYAHERGVIHRDLKPANVKITPDGAVKVLDFGLAKVLDDEFTPTSGVDSPTMTLGHTRAGVILGTAAYMSPEQAVGKTADRRSDIFSFGAVFYEMLTGRRAFTGDSGPEILVAVAKDDPDWSKLPASTPRSLRDLLARCLTKDRRQRMQAIGEARIAMERPPTAEMEAAPAPSQGQRAIRLSYLGWVAAAVFAIAALALWAPWRSAQTIERPLVRLDVDLGADITLPPPETSGNTVVISPDGMRLAYVATVSDGATRLFTRRLDQAKAAELPGTQGALGPFFSPDGQWIGFFAANKIDKISVEGGAVVPVGDAVGVGSWGEDGNIYTNVGLAGLFRIPSSGGSAAKLTDLESGKEFVHADAQLLPGGKALLFTSYALPPGPDTANVEVFTFADRRRKVLVRGGVYGRYLPTASNTSSKIGHLIYGSRGSLFAVPFDLERLELRGTALPVLDNVANDPQSGKPQVEVSGNGTVVYRTGSSAGSGMMTVQWVDRSGAAQPLLAKPGLYQGGATLSPDGKRLAMQVREGAVDQVWVYDWQRDASTKLTFSGGPYVSPIWSPDGRFIVTGSLATGMYWIRSDGSGQPQQLTQSKAIQAPWSFAPDGKRLAFTEIDLAGGQTPQIWIVSMEETGGQWKAGKPEQFLKTKSVDQFPQFSPDGRWLAYESNESGIFEVYVRPFPLPASGQGGKWTISTGGGQFPVWSRTGNELLYQAGDQVMAVSYAVKGETFVADKPRVWIPKLGGAQIFSLAPDGRRIAVVTPAQAPEAPKADHQVIFLFNFFDELRRRVPLTK